jgi:hypothetical protein
LRFGLGGFIVRFTEIEVICIIEDVFEELSI